MTSTSIKPILMVFSLLVLVSAVSGYYYNSDSSSFDSTSTGFVIPQYDSQMEVATQLVAPFLLISIILQIALERGLSFTLDTNNNPLVDNSTERKKLKKQSMIMALIITGMTVPSPLFRYIDEVVSVLFGGAVYLFFGLIILGFLRYIR